MGNSNIEDFEQYCDNFSGATDQKAIGESSASYIFYPGTAERIKGLLPDVKLLAILRHPVERAYSEYWHHWKMGRRLTQSFHRFVMTEKIDEEPNVGDYQDCIRRGLYFRQLEPYWKLFSSDQLLILLSDDLKNDTPSVMKQVFRFLDVDDAFMPDTSTVHNQGIMPGKSWKLKVERCLERLVDIAPLGEPSKRRYRLKLRRRLTRKNEPINPKFRQQLVSFFEHDVRELEQALGRDLSAWLR